MEVMSSDFSPEGKWALQTSNLGPRWHEQMSDIPVKPYLFEQSTPRPGLRGRQWLVESWTVQPLLASLNRQGL